MVITLANAVPTAQARTASARNGSRRLQQRIAAHRHTRLHTLDDVQQALSQIRANIETGNHTVNVGDSVKLIEISIEAANMVSLLFKNNL